MSKLSEAVKALINAGHASPGYTRASAQVKPALARFASDATEKKVGLPAWITLSVSGFQLPVDLFGGLRTLGLCLLNNA